MKRDDVSSPQFFDMMDFYLDVLVPSGNDLVSG